MMCFVFWLKNLKNKAKNKGFYAFCVLELQNSSNTIIFAKSFEQAMSTIYINSHQYYGRLSLNRLGLHSVLGNCFLNASSLFIH
jgi:hypothetical protein